MRRKADRIEIGLGARIRARRKVVGMTQAELAGAIKVSSQQLQKYEKGQNAVSSERLARICEALKLPPDYFAHSTGDSGGVPPKPGEDGRVSESIGVDAFVGTAEGRRLVESFMAIDDRMLRTRILDFIASFAHHPGA